MLRWRSCSPRTGPRSEGLSSHEPRRARSEANWPPRPLLLAGTRTSSSAIDDKLPETVHVCEELPKIVSGRVLKRLLRDGAAGSTVGA